MEDGFYSHFDYSLNPYDECDDDWIIREQRRNHEEQRGIKRDKKSRLKKGSQLAKIYEHKNDDIWLRYLAGMTPAQIVETTGYSKSSVYDVIKKMKIQTGKA